MLVIGGGIIGLEMATVYDALGSKITVVELMDQLMPGADKDLVQAAAQAHRQALRSHHLKTKVTKIEATKERPEGHLRRRTSTRSRNCTTAC